MPLKKLLAVLFICFSLPASAQGWVRYAQDTTGSMYFDSLRTRKMGDTAFVWDLHDLNTAQLDREGHSYQSVAIAAEYQCRARKWRALGLTRHPRAMGVGPVLSEEPVSDWSEIVAGSLPSQLFRHICE
jgi:hypothetical protein